MKLSYCVKCRTKTEMKDIQSVKMKNGRSASKGKCSVCGTGVYRIESLVASGELQKGLNS